MIKNLYKKIEKETNSAIALGICAMVISVLISIVSIVANGTLGIFAYISIGLSTFAIAVGSSFPIGNQQ